MIEMKLLQLIQQKQDEPEIEIEPEPEQRPFCSYCGNDCDDLYPVVDEDRGVGYFDVIEVCWECRDRRGR